MLCNPLLMLSGLGGWRAEGQKRFGKNYLKIQWTSVKATDLGPACRKPLPEPTARAEVRRKNVCETVQLLSCIWTYEMSDTD